MSDKSSENKFGNIGGDIGAFAGGDITGVAGKNITGAAGGDISGTVTTTIGQLQESNTPEAPKLADLLKQLQKAINTESQLPQKEKDKALKQLKALAEAVQNPQEEEKQTLADTALTMLKGIVSGLPSAAGLLTEFHKLLPAIAQIFGLSI